MDHTVRPRGIIFKAPIKAKNLAKKLEQLRPISNTMHSTRDGKQQVYEKAADQARRFGIKGNYVGLAAQYMPEIFTTYHGVINGLALNIERNEEMYQGLVPYTKAINNCFPYRLHHTKFQLCCDNILRALVHNALLLHKVSVIDLDLMCCINTRGGGVIDDIVTAAKVAATEVHQLLVWTMVGRNITYEGYGYYADKLDRRLFEHFRLVDYAKDIYRDHKVPMAAERYILRRR